MQKLNISEKVNTEEAQIIADMLRRLYRQLGEKFNAQKSVGIIVPYRNQIAMIRKEIEKLGIPALEDISIDTVERIRVVNVTSFFTHSQFKVGISLTSSLLIPSMRRSAH